MITCFNSRVVEVSEWYICFNAVDFSGKPPAFTGFNLPLLKLSLQDSERLLNKIEKIMKRPAASKKLPFNVRVSEIWEWLNPDVRSGVCVGFQMGSSCG